MSLFVEGSGCHVQFGHRITREPNEEYQLHLHNYFEVYYFVSGEVSYLVEGRRYTPAPDSMLMLPPGIFHGVRVENEVPYERFALHFVEEALPVEQRPLLLEAFFPKNRPQGVYYERADRFRIRPCLENLEECAVMPDGLRDEALDCGVAALLAHITYMSRSTENSVPREAGQATVHQILQYLNSHLTEPVTLDELSARFFISKHHLNKVFRAAAGTTVMDYLLRKRVALAQGLIAQGMPASQAAMEAGFHDYSVFYRACRRLLNRPPIRSSARRT